MSIEIYDKATIVKKDNRFYYLLKYGSKNSFTCGHQSILDNNFRRKYISRDSRDSDWSLIAIGDTDSWTKDTIADTYWNATTGQVYGQVRFGNKKNIALWYVKNKNNYLSWEELDPNQQSNLTAILEPTGYTIDLQNIPEHKRLKATDTYCGTETPLAENTNALRFNGRLFWNLDNL